jgi:hypothetical protein
MEHARQKGHKSGWAECGECGRYTVQLTRQNAVPVPLNK